MTTLRIFFNDIAAQTYEWLLFDDFDSVRRQSKDALNNLPIADEIEVVIPTEWVSFTAATLPAGSRKRILDALPYLIEDHLVASPEQVHVVIAEHQENNRAMLASIDKQTLTALLQTLKAQNIRANTVLPASLITPFHHNHWVMVCEDAHCFLRTSISSGIALAYEDDDSPPIELELALQKAKSTQSLPQAIIVYGNNNANLSAWSDQLGVPFQPSSTDWEKSPPKPGMNFLQGAYTPDSQGWEALSQAKPALMMLFAMVALALIGSTIDWARKSYEKNQLDKQMKALFLNTFSEARNVVDAPLQMQRNLSDLQHASGETQGNDFLPLLANISKSTGGLANITAMRYQAEQLSISLQAANEALARTLAQKINVPGRTAVIENLKPNAGTVSFDLVFKADGQ